MNIAIDGPAGAGKSTIAKKTAKELGYIYVDTGAMYRGIALYLLENDIDISDAGYVEKKIEPVIIEIKYESDMQQIYLNGNNVTSKLREEAVGNMASKSSALPCVRAKLLDLQRQLAKDYDVVMDGRDIGTNILPDAEVKVYLTASSKVRARRRYDEIIAKGETADINVIEADIITRDKQDMERETAPLRQAEDAVYIDSSDMTIDEVVATIIRLTKK
ncbi:MAG: (d)CMP kinase [Coprococcus sp.]|nr:(d)CMP kinase [Coprococcus sp.]